jgi:hypothetical protein
MGAKDLINKCFLNTAHVPSTDLDSQDSPVNKRQNYPCTHGAYDIAGRETADK